MPELSAPPGARRRRSRWLRLAVAVAVTLAAVEYGVLPTLVAARKDMELLASASVPILVAALVLEVLSVTSWTGMTRSVLRRGEVRSWPRHLAIDVTGLGAGHVLPGGAATAAALRYRLMTAAGVSPRATMSAVAVQTVLGDLSLAVCYLLGVLVAVTEVRHHPVLVLTAVLGTLVVGLAALAAVRLGRDGREDTASAPLRPGWLRTRGGRWGRVVARRARQVSDDVAEFVRDDTRTAPAVGYALANWLLDAACLWLCLWAYGDLAGPGAVLVVYGFSNLLGLLPVTPGGLGVVEGTMIPLLIAFGVAAPVAVLGVLTWRLMQFWLPIPVALVAYVGLSLVGRLGPTR